MQKSQNLTAFTDDDIKSQYENLAQKKRAFSENSTALDKNGIAQLISYVFAFVFYE